MRRVLPESVLEEVGALDAGAIAQVRDEAWPDVRDADELHGVLHTLVALPEGRSGEGGEEIPTSRARNAREMGHPVSISGWGVYFEWLLREGRAGVASVDGRRYWVAAERARSFAALFPAV